MIFDTHAHMDDKAFDADRETLLTQLPSEEIALIMNPGCSLASSVSASQIANCYDYVYAAVGSHPDAANEVDGEVLAQYRNLAFENPKVKAIGEIGLDYHYEDIPREIQKEAFRAQMALADELRLPVIIHEREAHEDAMKIIAEFPHVTGVFHCYSGSTEMACELIKKGWYIGFGGVLTFKNARRSVETASRIPLERIVLETDCPYMSPEPFRGRRNDPTRLHLVAQKLASVCNVFPEEIEEITLKNGKKLYRIED